MTQFNSGYEVQRSSGQCAFTGRQIEPGQAYMATLVEVGDSFERVDVSLEAWERGDRPEALFSYWRTVLPEPEKKQKVFVDDEVLMNLLQRLEGAEQPQRVAFRFVLALILMRKKLLRYDGSERVEAEAAGEAAHGDTEVQVEGNGARADQEWWLMTPKLDVTKGPMGKWDEQNQVRVLDPRLDEDGIRQVTGQLSEILQAEL